MQRLQRHVNKATRGSASYSEARSRRPPWNKLPSPSIKSVGRRIANKTSQHGLCRGGEGFIEERIIKLEEEIRRKRARSLWCSSEARSRQRWAHPYHAGEGWTPQHADPEAGEGKPISGLTCSKRSSTSNRKASLSIGHAGPEHAETSLDSIQKWPESRLHSKDPREKERKQRQDSRMTVAPADLQARCQVKRSETQLQE